MILPPYFLVFDVESIGLHGEPFAVGYVVVGSAGNTVEEGLFSCPPEKAQGSRESHQWVKDNCRAFEATHRTPYEVVEAFGAVWLRWKEKKAWLAADCAWPVEANFLEEWVCNALPQREWQGPYPLIDIGSVLFAKGIDPLATHDRLPSELPAHDPLADARQSARLFIECLVPPSKRLA